MSRTAICRWLQQLGQGTEADAQVLLDVLLAIPTRSTLVAGPLHDVVLKQAVSINYQLRQAARQLLMEAGVSLPTPVTTPLPAAYLLRFDTRFLPVPNLADLAAGKRTLAAARELVRPYDYTIELLAEQANLDSRALCYRAVAIMEEMCSPGLLTGKDDQDQANQLAAVRLQYKSIPPRVAAARRAVMQLVTELLDADVLAERWAARHFSLRDYSPDSFAEVAKPAFVPALKRNGYSHVANDWVASVQSSEFLRQSDLSIYQPDWLVIGEYSLVRSLNWGTATEIRMVHLTGSQLATEDDESIFDVVFNELSAAYYTLGGLDLQSLVVQHQHFLQHSFKSEWLAFNPALARHLGWEQAPGQLFGWQDKEANLLVKSVYWANGNMDMPPPQLESEAGEGWLVLASARALAQLSQLDRALFVEKSLIRSHRQQYALERTERSSTARLAFLNIAD